MSGTAFEVFSNEVVRKLAEDTDKQMTQQVRIKTGMKRKQIRKELRKMADEV